MLNFEELKKAKEKYNEAKRDYYLIMKNWKERAKEICDLYMSLDKIGKVRSDDIISIDFLENDSIVEILVKDFEEDIICDYCVEFNDFIADDFKDILTEKYNIMIKNREEKIKKELEEKEMAEYERLKQKYGA